MISRSRASATPEELGHERVDLPFGREHEESPAERWSRRRAENRSLDDFARDSEVLEVIQCIEEIELWRGLGPLGEERRDGSGTDTEYFRIQ